MNWQYWSGIRLGAEIMREKVLILCWNSNMLPKKELVRKPSMPDKPLKASGNIHIQILVEYTFSIDSAYVKNRCHGSTFLQVD